MTLPGPQQYITTHRMTTRRFANWLRARLTEVAGGSIATVVEGRVADMPNLSVSVDVAGSGEESMNGTFEVLGMHLQSRGMPNNIDSSETLALAIDDIVLTYGSGFSVDDVQVASLWRPGPRPQQLTFPDSGDRFIFSVNYQMLCSTGLGTAGFSSL